MHACKSIGKLKALYERASFSFLLVGACLEYEIVQVADVAFAVVPATHIFHESLFWHRLSVFVEIRSGQEFSNSLTSLSTVRFHGKSEHRHGYLLELAERGTWKPCCPLYPRGRSPLPCGGGESLIGHE